MFDRARWRRSGPALFSSKERRLIRHNTSRSKLSLLMTRLLRGHTEATRKLGFRGEGKGRNETSNRVVCGHKHMLSPEMWENSAVNLFPVLSENVFERGCEEEVVGSVEG